MISAYGDPVWSRARPPEINIQLRSDGRLVLIVAGDAGEPYRIEASENLRHWQPVHTNWDPRIEWVVPLGPRRQFFRADPLF